MSSSIFVEPNKDDQAKADLVVVYNKKNLSSVLDLETLIEEKAVKSISVIRISSPTPSMQDEEESAKLEEAARKQEESSSDGDDDSGAETQSNPGEDARSSDLEGFEDKKKDSNKNTDELTDENASDASSDDDPDDSVKVPKKRGRKRKLRHKIVCKKKLPKPRSEVLGLNVESFFNSEDASRIVKEVLKMAGLSTIKRTPELEFQLYVIQNDHCYTTYTSPEQMKAAKLAAKRLEAKLQEQECSSSSTDNYHIASKQQLLKRKLLIDGKSTKQVTGVALAQPKFITISKSKGKALIHPKANELKTQAKSNPRHQSIEDEEEYEILSVTDEGSPIEDEGGTSGEIESEDIDSDNDRDSDLDFKVNKAGQKLLRRKGAVRRKLLLQKAQRINATKILQHRDLRQQALSNTAKFERPTEKVADVVLVPGKPSITQQRFKATGRILNPEIASRQVRIPNLITNVNNKPKIQPLESAVNVKSKESPLAAIQRGGLLKQTTLGNVIKRSTILPMNKSKVSIFSPVSPADASPPIKEFIINKVIQSPKGVFTELTSLMSESECKKKPSVQHPTPIKKHCNITPDNSSPTLQRPVKTIANVQTDMRLSNMPGPSSTEKGFMRIDADSKNHLPAQISVQTHISSSELEAEQDKQLDLIDAIVKDKLQADKTATHALTTTDTLESASAGSLSTLDESIPNIVKMLEESTSAPAMVANVPHDSAETNAPKSNSFQETISVSDINTNYDFTRKTDSTGPFRTSDEPSLTSSLSDKSSTPAMVPAAEVVPMHRPPSSTTADAVNDIDISNDFPEELLQQVVELFNENKTLQAVVEKEILTGGHDSEVQHAENSSFNTLQHQPTELDKSIMDDVKPSQPPGIINTTFMNTEAGRSTVNNPVTPKIITRKDGRTITLPPIEAPTTRAKRRAQGQPTPNSSFVASLNESSLDNSSNASFSMDNLRTISSTEGVKSSTSSVRNSVDSMSGASNIFTNATTQPASKASKKTAARRSVTKKARAAATSPKSQEDDTGHTQDDDDPNKLWCICRQPHNNRFMICCDICEDWFHGTCVNITKAMGREMEQNGVDWTCPHCVKKQAEKNQRKITDMLQPKTGGSADATSLTNTPISESNRKILTQKVTGGDVLPFKPKKTDDDAVIKRETKLANKSSVTPFDVKASPSKKPVDSETGASTSQSTGKSSISSKNTKPRRSAGNGDTKAVRPSEHSRPTASYDSNNHCIVCKRHSKANSIYCSDECLRRHTTNVLNCYATKEASSEKSEGVQQPVSPAVVDDKKKKGRGLFEDQLSMADRKPKVERVMVYDRKSGHVLTGSHAPTTIALKRWIQEHPSYEAVLPGSPLAAELEQKLKEQDLHLQKHPQAASDSPRSVVNTSTHKSNSPAVSSAESPGAGVQKTLKQMFDDRKPSTPKQIKKYPPQVQIKPDSTSTSDDDAVKHKKRASLKKHSSESASGSRKHEKTIESPTSRSNDSDATRAHARNMLKENLRQRMLETNDQTISINKLSEAEIDHFCDETEEELYKLFNNEAGSKYKAKLRSLVFNVKDSKNRTLFAKICNKLIEPKHFVRMTPEELASQELAEWRAQENKHQLEMIKKSELDLLSCTKQYVFKNHKGEEVLGTSEEQVNLDRTIPVEDVVVALNSSVDQTTDAVDEKIAESAIVSDKTEEHRSTEQSLEKSATSSKESSIPRRDNKDPQGGSRRHKSKDRHTAKSRSHRSRSRSRSDSRSRSSSYGKVEKRHKRHKSDRHEGEGRDSHRTEKRTHGGHSKSHGSKERPDRLQERSKNSREDNASDQERSPTRPKSRGPERTHKFGKDTPHQKGSTVTTSAVKFKIQAPNPIEAVNLVDKILESSKSIEEAANLLPGKEKKVESLDTANPVENRRQKHTITCTDSDQEPSSTVSIPTPPQDPYLKYIVDGDEEPTIYEDPILQKEYDLRLGFWSGRLNMIDVSRMQVVLQPVSGSCVYLEKLLPDHLEVVGRIAPEPVYDYISKVKKAFNKDIIIIRIIPENEAETAFYVTLFDYLHTRKRLGVIKSSCQQIKDFYIYPLAAGAKMPPVLQPADRKDFFEDPYRPDIMMGIIVRVSNKRLPSTPHYPSSSAVEENVLHAAKTHRSTLSDSFTPPGSPKRKKYSSKKGDMDIDAIVKAPIFVKPQKGSLSGSLEEADEPYSPGDSSDEDLQSYSRPHQANSSTSRTTCHSSLTVRASGPSASSALTLPEDNDLKRRMEEINRRIAVQEQEIAGLLKADSANFGDVSTTAATAANVLANISIPSNLSQILASITNKTPSTPPALDLFENMEGTEEQPPPVSSMFAGPMEEDGDEEYNPESPLSYKRSYKPNANNSNFGTSGFAPKSSSSGGSRLAQLTEAELLSMVPDEIMNAKPSSTKNEYSDEPPPPGV